MAPHGKGSDDAVEAMVAQVEKHPISSILIIIAIQTEVLPVVNNFQLTENPLSSFLKGVSWVHYHGTTVGFKVKGAMIGDVFLASHLAFHDRRIPIPVFDLYGVGLRQALSTPNLLKVLNLKIDKLSTGDSLDISPQDEASITANDATVKDMEGTAVAYVADLLKVPAIFVKVVTDIVNGEKPTIEEPVEFGCSDCCT